MKPFSLVHHLRLTGAVIGRAISEVPAVVHGAGQLLELLRAKVIYEPAAIIVMVALLLVGQPFLASQVSAQDKTIDDEKIEKLEQLIEAQQKQIGAQQKQLEYMQQELNQLKKTATDAKAEAEEAKSVAEASEKRVDVINTAKAKNEVQASTEKVVTSAGGKRTKLSISGWVNRAVNIVDDGKDTDAYFVDNDNAESRVNFTGTAKVTDDLTLGSMIELTIAPNKASNVNQEDQDVDNVFEQRITEATLDSKRFGKLSLGKVFRQLTAAHHAIYLEPA